MSRPPLPGLIPLSSFSSKSATKNNLKRGSRDVMRELRSRRTETGTQGGLINNSQQRRSGRTRRKSQRKHKQVNSSTPDVQVNPRVNPIFVWIRQEDNRIVDVKCEDYDKRNRIVLTKTPNGWRAMPRTETLGPNLKAAAAEMIIREDSENPRESKKNRRKSRKVKKVSTGVQVDTVISTSAETETETERAPEKMEEQQPQQSKPEIASPLDNLLAVAELELAHQIQEEAVNVKVNEVSLDIEVAKNTTECDYTEEEDLVMNQLLMQLEESLQSPEAMCTKPVEDPPDDQPTDLSLPKVASPRPPSRCSTVIQSPQPSGLPPVPPSPDVNKTDPKPTDYDETISSSLPEKKKDEDDVILRAMLSHNDESVITNVSNNKNLRLLELLRTPEPPSPLAQLKQLLTDPNVSVPDPLLIPRENLSAVLTSPGTEIPKLLCTRPELRLPEVLRHQKLCRSPDVIVLTVHHLKTVLEKQAEAGDGGSSPSQFLSYEAHSLRSLLAPTMLIPYLQQAEMAMALENQEIARLAKAMLPTPVQPPSEMERFRQFYAQYGQYEYPIYQQATPTMKNPCYPTNEKKQTPKFAPYPANPYVNGNHQVPQQQRKPRQQRPKPHPQQSRCTNRTVCRDRSDDHVNIQTGQTRQCHSPQPMDLSGFNVMLKRSKYNQMLNYSDSYVGANGNVRFEDTVPEVGSTTTTVDEFAALSALEASKNMWHPFFAGPNGPANPNTWNWPTSLAAMGE